MLEFETREGDLGFPFEGARAILSLLSGVGVQRVFETDGREWHYWYLSGTALMHGDLHLGVCHYQEFVKYASVHARTHKSGVP